MSKYREQNPTAPLSFESFMDFQTVLAADKFLLPAETGVFGQF